MKKHQILFIVVCILCLPISIAGIVYPIDPIYLQIEQIVFTLSLFLFSIRDFWEMNEKREFKHYLFIVVSSLAFILTLYRAII